MINATCNTSQYKQRLEIGILKAALFILRLVYLIRKLWTYKRTFNTEEGDYEPKSNSDFKSCVVQLDRGVW